VDLLRLHSLLAPEKEMNITTIIAPLTILLATMSSAAGKPTNIKESEFLLSCRPPCEKDAAGLGHSPLESKRRCDCYCRVVFHGIGDPDVEYFKGNRQYAPSTFKLVESAFLRCFAGEK